MKLVECSCKKCHWVFRDSDSLVLPLDMLYEQVRNSRVRKSWPLQRREVLKFQYSRSCSFNREFREHGIELHPAEEILRLMERWQKENAARREMIRQAYQAKHQQEKEARKKAREDAKKSQPTTNPTPQNAPAPKNYGDNKPKSAEESKPRKKKGGDDTKKGGKQKGSSKH